MIEKIKSNYGPILAHTVLKKFKLIKTLKVTTDVENKITTFVESDGTIIYEKSI